MNKRIVFSVAAAVLCAAGLSVTVLWPEDTPQEPSSALCWGGVLSQTTAAAPSARPAQLNSQDTDVTSDEAACGVFVDEPAERGQFRLSLHDAGLSEDPADMTGREPVGPGIDGWITQVDARATLPTACGKAMGRPEDAVQLRLITSARYVSTTTGIRRSSCRASGAC